MGPMGVLALGIWLILFGIASLVPAGGAAIATPALAIGALIAGIVVLAGK
jgi:hypothetical protein